MYYVYMVVDLKVLDRIVDEDDPEHIKISFGESFFADTQEKQKRHTGCQQLSRRHMLTSSEVFILYLPVKKKPLTLTTLISIMQHTWHT